MKNKELTHKQQRFIEEYLIDGNAAQSYRRAGYKATTDDVAKSEGFKLLTKPYIRQEIEKRRLEQTSKAGITADFVLNGIKTIAENPKAKDSDKLKAFELLGKNLQLFTDVTKQVLPDNLVEIQGLIMKFKAMGDDDLKYVLGGGSVDELNK